MIAPQGPKNQGQGVEKMLKQQGSVSRSTNQGAIKTAVINNLVHDTAIIAPSAKIGKDVSVGPYTLIGPEVTIGDGSIIGARVTIEGDTTIGHENEIFDGAIIGCRTQDLKFDGVGGPVVIGDNNMIREYVTISAGTHSGETTRIGNHNLLMTGCHIGHGSQIGDEVKIANATALAGHVEVHDYATVGGLTSVHQFCRIGKFSMIGAGSKVSQDVPPFMMCDGHPVKAYATNAVGLKRANFSSSDLAKIKKAYKHIFRSQHTPGTALKILKDEFGGDALIRELVDFLENTNRGICK